MRACLFGAETEYALAALRSDGTGAGHAEVHDGFMACAQAALAHLPHDTNRFPGLFLTNGGRLYLDCGYRIEYATPEVTTPTDLVRYVRAGDLIVAGVLRRLRAERRDWSEVFCSRVGVDYLHRTAWGAHESVLLRERDPGTIGQAMLPFLVTRVLYAGAGGFDAHSPGIRFLISPRASFITTVASSDTMRNRPILSTRDEPLAHAPYRRLHVACADTLCSDTGLYLRAGATALTARVLERSPGAASGLTLREPVAALHAIAADPTCRHRVPMQDGRRLSAIEIQRGYLSLVEADAGAEWMPEWAPDVCRRWRWVLDRLADDPGSMSTTLDWAIKWTLYRRYIERHGVGRRGLVAINRALEYRGWPARDAQPKGTTRGPCLDWWVRLPDVPEPSRRDAADPFGASTVPDAVLDQALACRVRLFELDARWGELGPRGIFDALDASGCLSHGVEGCDDREDATDRAPSTGRAHVRGAVVRRLWNERRPARCSWVAVRDERGLVLDLADPFATGERWV